MSGRGSQEGFPDNPEPWQEHVKGGEKYIWHPDRQEWIKDGPPPVSTTPGPGAVVTRRPPEVEAGL